MVSGAAIHTSRHVRSATAPISHTTISLIAKGVGERLMARLIKAPARLAIISPASVNSAIPPLLPAISASNAMAPPAPISANSGNAQPVAAQPVQNESTAPNAAPGAIPNSPGSASGLRR